VPRDRVTSSSARIFALWITVPAIIMVIISLIFLKIKLDQLLTLPEQQRDLVKVRT
jgi:two-component system osmolarity sensor histidine kinase EnvZ